MEKIEHFVSGLSLMIWGIFLPLIVISSIYLAIKFWGKVQNETTEKSTIKLKQIIAPVAISLGAMVGTGAIIGVLGSAASLFISGQQNVEAIAGWAIVGAIILLPLSYIETVVAKTTKMSPKEYISIFLNSKLAKIYAISFVTMYILGFGGFQFQGINSTFTILTNNFLHIELSMLERYQFIALPLLIIVSVIVLTKKHDLFINAMTYFIGIGVFLYLLFLIVFALSTGDYIGDFFNNMIEGMKNPITASLGIPVGIILSFQRIIQTSEPGLGALGMSSLESDSNPRPAGFVALGTSLITIFIAIFTTTYIISYGFENGLINLLDNDPLNLLEGFFLTGYAVVGMSGVVIMILFTILSGITTLLGSYYFLDMLFDIKENTQIAIYISILTIASILAIFGASLIFEIVDLLLFLVAAINIAALVIYVNKKYKAYRK